MGSRVRELHDSVSGTTSFHRASWVGLNAVSFMPQTMRREAAEPTSLLAEVLDGVLFTCDRRLSQAPGMSRLVALIETERPHR